MDRKRKKEKKLKKLYKKLKKVLEVDKNESSDSGSEQEYAEAAVQPPEPPQLPTEMVEVETADQQKVDQDPEFTEIDTEILMAMGVVEEQREKGPSVHPEITTRMTTVLHKGLHKEEKSELMKKYLPFENVPAMVPPKLNPEVCAAVSEVIRKRDLIIQGRQQQTCAALSALGTALNLFLLKGNKIEIIKHINDASRIMCDSIHTDTYNRRQLLIGVVNKDLKEALQGEPDVWLFGSDLGDKIKNTRTVQRSGQELKNNPTFKPIPNTRHKGATFKPRALNWRGPPRPSSNRSATAGGGGRPARKPAAEKKKYRPRNRH